jgi:hypothetical protein
MLGAPAGLVNGPKILKIVLLEKLFVLSKVQMVVPAH